MIALVGVDASEFTGMVEVGVCGVHDGEIVDNADGVLASETIDVHLVSGLLQLDPVAPVPNESCLVLLLMELDGGW